MWPPGKTKYLEHEVYFLRTDLMLKIKSGRKWASIPEDIKLVEVKPKTKRNGFTYIFLDPQSDHMEIKILLDYCTMIYGNK